MEYISRKGAIEAGLIHAGYEDADFRNLIMKLLPEPTIAKLEWPHNTDIEVYKLRTPSGKDFQIGVGKFKEGFDLWLMNPESGVYVRT